MSGRHLFVNHACTRVGYLFDDSSVLQKIQGGAIHNENWESVRKQDIDPNSHYLC
jgi:hypothetical protein